MTLGEQKLMFGGLGPGRGLWSVVALTVLALQGLGGGELGLGVDLEGRTELILVQDLGTEVLAWTRIDLVLPEALEGTAEGAKLAQGLQLPGIHLGALEPGWLVALARGGPDSMDRWRQESMAAHRWLARSLPGASGAWWGLATAGPWFSACLGTLDSSDGPRDLAGLTLRFPLGVINLEAIVFQEGPRASAPPPDQWYLEAEDLPGANQGLVGVQAVVEGWGDGGVRARVGLLVPWGGRWEHAASPGAGAWPGLAWAWARVRLPEGIPGLDRLDLSFVHAGPGFVELQGEAPGTAARLGLWTTGSLRKNLELEGRFKLQLGQGTWTPHEATGELGGEGGITLAWMPRRAKVALGWGGTLAPDASVLSHQLTLKGGLQGFGDSWGMGVEGTSYFGDEDEGAPRWDLRLRGALASALELGLRGRGTWGAGAPGLEADLELSPVDWWAVKASWGPWTPGAAEPLPPVEASLTLDFRW